MKKLNLIQMENLQAASQPATCGQAIVMGAMLGGMFGPGGALAGAIIVGGFSTNCNP